MFKNKNFKSSNPAFRGEAFDLDFAGNDAMTVNGTVNKIGMLLLILIASAAYAWSISLESVQNGNGFPMGLMAVGAIGGLIVAIITIFKKTIAMYTAPIYAILEGLLLGSMTIYFELRYPGIATQAIMGTFGVFLTMLFLYRTGLVKVTDKFRSIMSAAIGGIFVIYLATFVLGLFSVEIPYIHSNGLVGIGFSVVVVGIASFSLLLDFDMIEKGAQNGAPKYMEWYGAFALLVTLVWLYMEILRLLVKLNSRD